jgi:hypothetical protein
MIIWGLISMFRAKKELRLEREEWETDNGEKSVAGGKFTAHHAEPDDHSNANGSVAASKDTRSTNDEPDLEAGRGVV